MYEFIFSTGQEIYNAGVAGAAIGYNRSTDNASKYAEIISEHYQAMLADVINPADRRRIQKQTGNDWRKASLPLQLALVHKHIAGKPCAEHARVFLTTRPDRVFDIPMAHWSAMYEKHVNQLVEA